MTKIRRHLGLARHEAAHAVVGETLGIRITRVTIDDSGNGACHHDLRTLQRKSRFIYCIYALAGVAAEWHWKHTSRKYYTGSDFRWALKFHSRSDLEILEDLARYRVAKHSRTIERIARQLVKRDLTGKEVRTMMGKP